MTEQLLAKATALSVPRRSFLFGAAAVAAAATTALPSDEAMAADFLRRTEMASATRGARTLSFRNTHTLEELNVTYWRNGDYEQAALDEINYILRDFRTGQVHPISRGLLNMLTLIKDRMNTREPVHIISGYRSPKSNGMLRANSDGGVARRSFHLKGMAIDIRVPGVSTYHIARMAREMAGGGVGYYSSDDFTHVDAGPKRSWVG